MGLGVNINDKRDILMGTGKLIFDGRNVGQLKGDVVYTPKADYKEFKAGVPQQTIKKVKFSEGGTLKASMAELNFENFGLILGTSAFNKTYTDVTTPETGKISASNPIVLSKGRYVKDVVLKKGTTTATLDTDYTLDSATGRILLKEGSSALSEGDDVSIASYKYLSKVEFGQGGGTTLPEKPVKYVYDSPDGDERITIDIPLGQIIGGQPITFKEEDFVINDIEIEATADSSKPAGQQLVKITYEFFPED